MTSRQKNNKSDGGILLLLFILFLNIITRVVVSFKAACLFKIVLGFFNIFFQY